jgi:hypothetical protein
MYVCLCLYVCMSMFVCMYVYVCMYVCLCMYVCMSMYVCMHVCMYVCMYVCLCMYACMHVCMYVCVYVCMYVCTHTHTTHTHMHLVQSTVCGGGGRSKNSLCQLQWQEVEADTQDRHTPERQRHTKDAHQVVPSCNSARPLFDGDFQFYPRTEQGT